MENINKSRLMRRREVIAGFAATGSFATFLAGCGRSPDTAVSCAGSDQLTASQRAARDGRRYVEVSSVDGQTCANCTFFKADAGDCGTCGIDSLPANPAGYCTSWVATTETGEAAQG